MTYNDPHITVTMTGTEMLVSVTLVRHVVKNMKMTMTVGVIQKKDGDMTIWPSPLMTPPLAGLPTYQ